VSGVASRENGCTVSGVEGKRLRGDILSKVRSDAADAPGWRRIPGRKRSTLLFVSALALALAALGGVAGANHSLFQHLSAGQVNGNGAFDADFQGASTNGTRVFFETAEQLVPGDNDAFNDVYERSAGTTTRVSAGQINGNRAFPAAFSGASADGSRVFFETGEKLVSGDTDANTDVYERSGGTTKRVSAGQINGNGASGAFFAGASTDGTRVFFRTEEQLVSGDTDAALDVYQRAGGTTKRVSAGQINGNGAADAVFVGAAVDGTRVFFHTNEQLVSGDTDNSQDIYERSGGTTKRVSAGQVNGNGAFSAFFAGASADGTRVFFHTDEKLVSADTDGHQDVYERSGGTTTRVSPGFQIVDATFQGASDDGTRVFFTTEEELVSSDTDIITDVYQRSGGSTTRISAGQINGNGDFPAAFDGASADGTRVFFHTEEQLVSGDTDTREDIYERSGGTTKQISAGQINGNGNFPAFFTDASDDGARVFFETSEPLVAADTDIRQDVYERAAGTTTKTSPGNGAFNASFAGASANGSAVFFETLEKVFASDNDDAIDVYGAYLAP
jgi:hypothetical protein